jgi:hypothetical protein
MELILTKKNKEVFRSNLMKEYYGMIYGQGHRLTLHFSFRVLVLQFSLVDTAKQIKF